MAEEAQGASAWYTDCGESCVLWVFLNLEGRFSLEKQRRTTSHNSAREEPGQQGERILRREESQNSRGTGKGAEKRRHQFETNTSALAGFRDQTLQARGKPECNQAQLLPATPADSTVEQSIFHLSFNTVQGTCSKDTCAARHAEKESSYSSGPEALETNMPGIAMSRSPYGPASRIHLLGGGMIDKRCRGE